MNSYVQRLEILPKIFMTEDFVESFILFHLRLRLMSLMAKLCMEKRKSQRVQVMLVTQDSWQILWQPWQNLRLKHKTCSFPTFTKSSKDKKKPAKCDLICN